MTDEASKYSEYQKIQHSPNMQKEMERKKKKRHDSHKQAPYVG